MTEPKRLKTVRTKLPVETAAFLREIADRAERGEVIAATAVVEFNDGTYRIESTGTLSRLQLIGALFEAAVSRCA